MKVGYRGSLLSLAQAGLVQQRYGSAWQQVIIQTEGDKDQKTPIAEMGGKSVFCSTIEKELLDGTIDVAIHSYKDMPGITTPGLTVNVVLPRNNCNDYLLGKINSLTLTQTLSSTLLMCAPRYCIPLSKNSISPNSAKPCENCIPEL